MFQRSHSKLGTTDRQWTTSDHYSLSRAFGSCELKKDPKSYFLTSEDPRHAPRVKSFAPRYSTLHFLWLDMQYDYVQNGFCTLRDHIPPGPVPRGYIKIMNVFLQSSSTGLSPVKVSSLNGLGAMAWHYRRTDVQMDGRGITISPLFLQKAPG